MKLLHSLSLAILALSASSSACLLPEERDGSSSTLRRRASALLGPSTGGFPVGGPGDRFSNGRAVPRGLGLHDRNLQSILTPTEVDSGLRALASAYPDDVSLFLTPHATHGGARLRGAVIGRRGSSGAAQPRVYIQAGIHARERGGPDDVIYFLADLLESASRNETIKYGAQTYSPDDARKALAVGFVVVPLVNPDGVAWDQKTNSCWRKNRNPRSASPSDPASYGIDLNRNYDFLWDYTRDFNQKANLVACASDDPTSDVFHGVAPASEPETRNVVWVMDRFPDLTWFLDLHSYGPDLLYSWGDDNPQTTDPGMGFANASYDGKRGFTGTDPANSRYREYVRDDHLRAQRGASQRMQGAMNQAGPTKYTASEAVSLYPTSGASTDYSMSRFYGHRCNASMLHGITLEFGEASYASSCPFYPSEEQYHQWMREVSAAFVELLLVAAEGGPPDKWSCEKPSHGRS